MTSDPDPGVVQARLGWICVWTVALATVVVIFRQPPEVMTDAGTCLLAAEQFHQGKSATFHTLVERQPANLQQEIQVPITWWPASYAAIPYLFRSWGLNWGQSLQVIVLLGWILGTWGWGRFFRQLLRPSLFPWFMLTFLTFRYTHANANVYDAGEFIYWVVFPWVLLINLHCLAPVGLEANRSRYRQVFLAGILTVCLVAVKYSAGLSAAGIAVAWSVLALRRQVTWTQLGAWALGALVATALVTSTGLLPGGNPGTVRAGMQWTALGWGPGAWTFAMTDLESLVTRITQGQLDTWLPAIGRYGDGRIVYLSPITLGLVAGLGYMAYRKPPGTLPCATWNPVQDVRQRAIARDMVLLHLITFSIGLTGLILMGSAIHMDSRFLRPASIALLPWILAGIATAIQHPAIAGRLVGYTSLAIFLVIPAGYGMTTAAYKTIVRGQWAAARTGPLGIRHDLLDPTGNAKDFYAELEQWKRGPGTTYYLLEHALALPMAHQPVLIEHAHLRTAQHLATKQYVGNPVDGVVLVVPRSFLENQKLAAIQRSFIDIAGWTTHHLVSQPNWLVMTSEP